MDRKYSMIFEDIYEDIWRYSTRYYVKIFEEKVTQRLKNKLLTLCLVGNYYFSIKIIRNKKKNDGNKKDVKTDGLK